MVANSSSDNTALSETANNQKQNWASSPSTVFNHFATSGLSVAIATSITHPLDVLKVRLQMQLVGQKGPLSGMGQLFLSVVKNEGPKSLYLGLTPALTRSVVYGGLRLGLYEPSKNACDHAFGSSNVLVKIASGMFAGAFATGLTNPMEVLKTWERVAQFRSFRGLYLKRESKLCGRGWGLPWPEPLP
ncbi:hypothetical protein KIW84_064572 [Lathyrus oleraceus]|uniref:Uncharacterized protein n=1 Tax=Pisum sativum TaxID=3888 RepID=A0A9D4WCL7_PEA|nr:hypothetical protein KIW84_064572 [Pisum sativum]